MGRGGVTGRTTYCKLADAMLVVRIQERDAEAFAELHVRYLPVVRAAVRGLAPRGTGTTAVEDLVQEVFTVIWLRVGDLREVGSFRAWLMQVVRCTVIDHARQVSCRPPTDHDDDIALALAADRGPGPAEISEATELAQRLEAGIRSLSSRDAAAITLASTSISHERLGIALDVSPGNARVIVHRARTRLRVAIDQPLVPDQIDATIVA